MKKKCLALCAAILLLVLSFAAFSRLYYHLSAMATAIEYYFRLKNVRAKYTDTAYADRLLEQKRQAADQQVHAPDNLKCDVREETVNGQQVFRVAPETPSDTTVIFLHGGAFVHNPNRFHWNFADNLARRTGASVVIPIYPLAPRHTFEETYALLDAVYAETEGRVILMGDSAGGSLAAGFSEYLVENGMPQSDHLILISPLMDGTFSNPEISAYEDCDPMLGVYGLKQICSVWAGDAGLADYRISPVCGDVSRLKNVTVFIGERDLFYPDCVRFYEKLQNAGVESRLVVGKGMIHDYVLLPIPEAWSAMDEICEIVAE